MSILTYENIKAKSGTFNYQYGITPSTGTLVFAPNVEAGVLPEDGELVFDDGTDSVTLHVWVDTAALNERTGDFQVMVKDRRWKWKFPAAFGQFNQPSGEYATPSEDKSAKELAIILLDQMNSDEEVAPYDANDIDMPTQVYPPVNWKFESAAQALEALCTKYGRRITIDFDGFVHIQPPTNGATPNLPGVNYLENTLLKFKDVELPNTIRVVGSRKVVDRRSFYSAVSELIPVAEDDTGDIVAVADIAYLTGGDGLLANLYTQGQGLSEERMARAKAQVARWYQIPEAQQSPEEAFKYLPILKVRARRIKVKGQWQQDEPIVEVDVTTWNMGGSGGYAVSANMQKVSGGYSLDYSRGIVKFSKELFGNGIPTPCANVKLIYAHESQEYDGTVDYLEDWYYYDKAVNDPRATAPVMTVHLPELVQYEDAITDPGTPWDNKDELDSLAEEYIDELVTQLTDVADPTTRKYSGIVKQFPVAGIDAVAFDLSAAGPTTTVQVQMEGTYMSLREGRESVTQRIAGMGR